MAARSRGVGYTPAPAPAVPSTAASVVATVKSALPAALPALDANTLASLRAEALKRVAELQSQTRLVAADLRQARSPREAGSALARALRALGAGGSATVRAAGRALVMAYFANSAWDQYCSWAIMRPHAAQDEGFPAYSFPWFGVCVLAPAALLAGLGVQVLAFGAVVLLWEAWDSAHQIWTQLAMLLLYGQQPNELALKRLAMMGCATLVLANSVRESKAASSYAGLLLGGGDGGTGGRRRLPGVRKSVALLLDRLLLTALFAYVGVTQMQRIIARDFILFKHIPHSALWERDGHDNNWLLLEFVLALPLGVGLRTGPVARLLAGTLAAEAATCWQFWRAWPTPSYTAHVRLHFVTNLGVAGGLLLLASFGAGRFTVDRLLEKKRR